MSASPAISVIIPTHNRAETLGRALDGVLAQTLAPLEVIVVDDASTDGTAAMIAARGDPRIRLIRHERNRGAGAARNTGVAAAHGELIAFQDSDDDWMPGKLARQAAHLAALGPDHVATFCTKIDYGRARSGESRPERLRYGPRRVLCVPHPLDSVTSGDMRARLLRGNVIGPQTALIRRTAFEAAGGFDTRLRNNEDWDFFIRLSEQGPIGFLDAPLALVITSEGSISRNRFYSAFSFVTIVGRIRRRITDDAALAGHYSTVASNLRRAGKGRLARRYLRRAIALQPLHPFIYLKYLYTFL